MSNKQCRESNNDAGENNEREEKKKKSDGLVPEYVLTPSSTSLFCIYSICKQLYSAWRESLRWLWHSKARTLLSHLCCWTATRMWSLSSLICGPRTQWAPIRSMGSFMPVVPRTWSVSAWGRGFSFPRNEQTMRKCQKEWTGAFVSAWCCASFCSALTLFVCCCVNVL